MTWIEHENKIVMVGPATLVEQADRELAWAEPHIRRNPAHAHLLAAYVETEKANRNKQRFRLKDMEQGAYKSVLDSPLNINHNQRRVIGSYVAAELLYPMQQAAVDPDPDHDGEDPTVCPNCGRTYDGADYKACPYCFPDIEEEEPSGTPPPEQHDVKPSNSKVSGQGTTLGAPITEAPSKVTRSDNAAATPNPVVETLAVVWKAYFPDEYLIVKKAFDTSGIWTSMEAVAERLLCDGPNGCGQEFDYAGTMSSSYCAHLQDRASDRTLVNPHFLGGAVIVPPVQPGWSDANVRQMVAANEDLAERIYIEAANARPHLDPKAWEAAMLAVMASAGPKILPRKGSDKAKDFSAGDRKKLAQSGKARSDGSFPIESVQDLKNAIQAFGRAKPSEKAAVKRHIISRAKALGATNVLPEGWAS